MDGNADFQLGFAAGFKLGSDAKDYKKQIEDFRAAEAAAKDAAKATAASAEKAQSVWEKANAAAAAFANERAAWDAKRDAELTKLDEDGDRVLAREQAVTRREGMLPERENAVLSREHAVKEREAIQARREAEAEAMRRKYERLIELQDAARAAV